jgi:DnaJ family protein C protein 7
MLNTPALASAATAAFQRGNAAYQAQQYRSALEAYSEALALNIQEPALNAVLLCNRAAALHACGQYLEAIADCCMAAQLDDKYPRVLQVWFRV